jgi:uncharacterized NAD(P)/FAD-binding protein YdhS
MSDQYSPPQNITILGAGFSGASLAVELHRRSRGPLRVTLVGASDDFARGTAYSTPYDYHLLNVPAAKMSALADEPDHLMRWLGDHHRGVDWNQGDPPPPLAKQFVPRQVYGEYLRSLLDTTQHPSEAGVTVERVASVAVSVIRAASAPAPWQVTLASGQILEADTVVLATGNEAPAPLLGTLPPQVFLNNPWQWETLRTFARKPSLLLVGTGLTMVDVALTLADEGHAGSLTALSRRGLTPRAHQWEASPTTFEVDFADAAQGPAHLRQQLELHLERHPDEGWRAAIDSLRPHTQSLWKSWSPEARALFLKEHRVHWDVRRHRIAPDIARQLAALRDGGRLEILTAGVVSAEPTGHGQVQVTIAPAHEPANEVERTFDGVINCTGPACDITAGDNPLFRSLLDAGHMRPDAHRLGIDVDDAGALRDADGHRATDLFAIGPLTKSQLWEIVAVPDIRTQTAALATHLVR